MYEGLIPFDAQGSPRGWAGKPPLNPGWDGQLEWRENKPFAAVLQFENFVRGRSAANALFSAANDHSWQVTMFLADFEKLLKSGRLHGLTVSSDWVYAKRGANFGITVYD